MAHVDPRLFGAREETRIEGGPIDDVGEGRARLEIDLHAGG